MTDDSICPGCGFIAPHEKGPTHGYMTSSAACWQHFNAIMAREYATPELMPTHYLSVDAYAAQHPGEPDDRRALQSVWIHLAGLHAVLREGHTAEFRYALLRDLASSRDSWPAAPPHAPFAQMAGTLSPDLEPADHIAAVRHWGETTLEAYEEANPDLMAQLAALA